MKRISVRIMKPSDAFLPAALWLAALSGRATISLWLFICYLAVKLCALATSDGLRRAFATQPSMRNVQGSAILALALQIPGALIAALILHITGQSAALYPLIACGLLLNIEHVFYEYLCSISDNSSATALNAITAVLTLIGLLLCAPRSGELTLPAFDTAFPLATTGIAALIGLIVSVLLVGRIKPRMSVEVLRSAPPSMLQAVLYPAAALALLSVLAPDISPALPLFSGLILYELCRSPFRRTPLESLPMNRALLITCAASIALAATSHFILKGVFAQVLLTACLAVLLAALCAFLLFGNIRRKGDDEA